MAYIGPSFARATKGDTFTFKFTMTIADVPTDLTTPTVKAYEEGSAVEFTGGITLTAPYDAKVGLNELVIDTSNAAYTAGKHYDFFFSAGSAGAVTLVGTAFFHLALIPEPADLRAVNGGSTGATAGKLELKNIVVDATGTAAAAVALIPAAHSSAFTIYGGAGTVGIDIETGNNAVYLYSDSGNGYSGAVVFVDGNGTNSPAVVLRSAGTGGYGIDIDSSGASGTEVTVADANGITIIPSATGKAINALGQVRIEPAADVAGLVINATGSARGLEIDAVNQPAVVAYSQNDYAILGWSDNSPALGLHSTGNDALYLEPTGGGKAINAQGQVSITPTNTNDDALKLVPNGTGKAIMAALAELAQGIPSATPSVDEALMLIYMALRNKLSVHKDTALKEVYNNAGTRIAKKAITDDGTTYSEGKMSSGA